MERYIDAKQIRYCWMYDADGKEHDGVTLQSVIDKVPTADVVPRAEVERETIDLLEGLYDFFRQDDSIREAFAILFAIAELKKKYMEETSKK